RYRRLQRGQHWQQMCQPGVIQSGVRWRFVGQRQLLYSVYERRLLAQLAGKPVPRHVAVMLDGNRRWAREAGFEDVTHGHRRGADKIGHLLEWCRAGGIEVVTLWLL